jgi:hypothetical protein
MILGLGLILGASALTADSSDHTWGGERPITKVIGLLKDMQAQIEKEGKEDMDMYDKLTCWCTSNEAEKTKAVADAKQHIEDLTAAIEGYTAKGSQLETEIAKLDKEIAKETSALDQATEIREKESAEFVAEEKEMTTTAATLGTAVTALSKAQGGAALPQESLIQIRQLLKRHANMHGKFRKGLSGRQNQMVMSLMQEGSSLRSSQPASGAIFGILKQMKESFETNLADATKDETQAATEYADLKSTKSAQIKASSDLSDSKSVELAETGDKKAEAKQDLEDTSAQLEADTKFLANVQEKCAAAMKAYDERQKGRSEELEAVSQTIGILTDDEAQQAFSKSSSFLQLSMRTRRMNAKEQASKILRKAGIKAHNRDLVLLATAARQDPMAAVKGQIDAMVAELKKTQKEEDDKKEYCDSAIRENEVDLREQKKSKESTEQKIADLEQTSTTLTEEIKALKAAVLDTQVEMKKAGEVREAENAEFQVTVNDQRATQVILKKALDKLKSFYEFVQVADREGQTPPAAKEYKKSGGATAVIMMIEGIIKEAKDIETKALSEENEAQADYETFLADSDASLKAMATDITNKSEAVAAADKEKVESEADLAHTIETILDLGKASVALHQDCDWLLKNYDARVSARAQEIDALNSAKAILSGAKFGFVQQ